MDAKKQRNPVKVFLPGNVIVKGYIRFTNDGPKLEEIEFDGTSRNEEGIEYSFLEEVPTRTSTISLSDRMMFESTSFIRKYTRSSSEKDELYPPSTNHWVTGLSTSGTDALLSIQKIKNEEKYLLSIVDEKTEDLIHLLPVNDYETNILKMETDWEYYNKVFVNTEDEEFAIEDLLEAPSPPWEDLAKLVEGVNIPNLKRYPTTGETLSQMIPSSYPESIRKQLMVFLAWTTRVKIPEEDPLDYLTIIDRRFHSNSLLLSLLLGHIQCLIQEKPVPQYIRIMEMVSRGSQTASLRPTTEEAEEDPWSITWHRIMEKFPDRKGRIIDLANSLNLKQEIHTRIPITREEARTSKKCWLDRFSMIRSGIIMRGHVQDQLLGLTKLVYIGGAHRWPHKHLLWTARFGNPGQKPPYIQVLLMPKPAVDRLTRTRENFSSIDWTASRWNLGLYNVKSDSWKKTTSRLQNSLQNKRTISQLEKEFGFSSKKNISIPSMEDAKLLDLLSWGVYLQTLELGKYDDVLHMNHEALRKKITLLRNSGVLQLQYFPTIYGLVSICLEVSGDLKHLCSIARASLVHLPSAMVMISKERQKCFIMARVPEDRAYDLLVDFPLKAQEQNLTMRGYRAPAYAGYIHNLYQRLLRPDGTWDDDVSDLLSQIRS